MKSSPEDTFRALKDLPTRMKFRCRLGFHAYTVWKEHNNSAGFNIFRQEKSCIYCNFKKLRKVAYCDL